MFSEKDSQKSSRIDGISLPVFCATAIIEVFMAPMGEPAKYAKFLNYLYYWDR